MNKISIIIPELKEKNWTGGETYQENLVESLRTRPDVCIYLIKNAEQNQVHAGSSKGLSKISQFLRQTYLSLNYQLSNLIFGYDRRLSKLLNRFTRTRTSVLFTNNHSFLNIKNSIIKMYWIPDFQHVHLPHLFTKAQLAERNTRFMDGCRKADIIILSSEHAQNDLARFAPEYLHKSKVSHFIASVKDSVWKISPSGILAKYSIPEKFFYLPNQFWKHKNHLVVFEAMKLLKSQGQMPHLVCTGNPYDYRNPAHFDELKSKIREWQLDEQIHILGFVPHDDVLLLIRQSIALINPSLFEGWSTTVEECKSIGKNIILSDIPVHREQAPERSSYFSPDDPVKLSEILLSTWQHSMPGPDAIQEKAARDEMPARRKEYADNFISIVKEYQKTDKVKKKAILNTPVLFLIFNRPEQTRQVFEAIKKVRPAKLYIAADGPRENHLKDKLRCQEAREVIHDIDWDCELRLLFREKNLSTKFAVSSAINWFFEQVEEGIIVEDDCLPDESFFNYCTELLDKYRDDESIMHINGSNYLLGKKFDFEGSYYFSRLCHPWGWATWRRAWNYYDIEMGGLDKFLADKEIEKITSNQGAIDHLTSCFTKTAAGDINTWDYQWFYTVWKNKGLAITPTHNLISNIGFGQDATHTNYKYTRLSEMKIAQITTLRHPTTKKINSAADEFSLGVSITEGRGNFFERLIVKIKLTLGIKTQ